MVGAAGLGLAGLLLQGLHGPRRGILSAANVDQSDDGRAGCGQARGRRAAQGEVERELRSKRAKLGSHMGRPAGKTAAVLNRSSASASCAIWLCG